MAADFNGDGKLDLAVANSGSNTVSILHGNGAGGFTLAQTMAVGAGPMQMASGDFNGDGRLDLAVTCYTGQCISVLLQNGAGSFQASTLPIPASPPYQLEGPRAIAIADADHDGKLDIIFTSSFRRYDDYIEDLCIYYGNGTGGFDANSNPTGDFDGSASPTASWTSPWAISTTTASPRSWARAGRAIRCGCRSSRPADPRGFTTPNPDNPVIAKSATRGR